MGQFLGFRRNQAGAARTEDPLLGIWQDPAPAETVARLGQMGVEPGAASPRVRESIGHEGEWYVCWLGADPGPQGEAETLDGLLELLLESGMGTGADPREGFAPCFASTTPEEAIRGRVARLEARYPARIAGAVVQDPVSAYLTPAPGLDGPDPP